MKKIFLILLLCLGTVYGQGFDGVSLGMAGNYSALNRGVDALGWNPAGLALARGNTVEINLFSINSALYNNSISFSSYNRYFTEEGHNNSWSLSDRDEILDLISKDGFQLDFDVKANIMGLAINNFGFAVQVVGQGTARLNEDKTLYEMALYGDSFTNDYSYNQTSQFEGTAYSALKFSIGYAYPVKIQKILPNFTDLAVGLSVNYYVGLGVVKSQRSDIMIQRFEDDAQDGLNYDALIEVRIASPEAGLLPGRGKGYDFGLATGYGKKWNFSLGFSNLFASIKWNNNTEMVLIHEADMAQLYEKDSSLVIDEDVEISEDTTFAADPFTTRLPSQMRFGASFQMLPNLTLTAEWQQGLNKAFGNSVRPRVGVGAQYFPLYWLPLRSGLAVGGREGFLFAVGTGLHFKYLDFSYSFAMKGALWPGFSRGIFNAFSLKVKF